MKDNSLVWGLLSTARINERVIPAIQRSPRSRLGAVASRSRETAHAFATRWSIPRVYGSYDELLRDPEIDVVYISLPNHLHAEWAVQCANAGKHVLCEKPLALTVAQVDRMAAAARTNGVVIQEAAMMNFHPQTARVRELLAGGLIGEVRVARGLFTFTLERADDIRFNPQMGGGSLWDVGSYCVRWFRTVLAREPYEVMAHQTTDHHGVDTNFSGELRFRDGAVAQFFSSFAAFAWTEADVLGSEGRMYLDMPWVNALERDAHVRWARVQGARAGGTFGDDVAAIAQGAETFESVNAYRDEIAAMVSSILDGAPPTLPLAESRRNTAVIVALLESARVNRPVAVETQKSNE